MYKKIHSEAQTDRQTDNSLDIKPHPPQQLLSQHKNRLLSLPKPKVGRPALHGDLPDQVPGLVPDRHAAPHARPHVPVGVDLEPVRDPLRREGKHPLVGEECPRRVIDNIVRVDRRRARRVVVPRVRVRDVQHARVGVEGEAVGLLKPVGHHARRVGRWIVSVHLVRQPGRIADPLLGPVRRVREPDRAAVGLVDDYVVGRVEGPPQEGCHHGHRGVGVAHRVRDREDPRRGRLAALRCEEDPG